MGYPEAQYAVDEITPVIEESKNDLTKELSKLGYAERGRQEFETSGTFIVPDNVHKIRITACGGGGGGAVGGGAGAAFIDRVEYTVQPGEIINIIVGIGGAGTNLNEYSSGASNGGATVIGDIVTLQGGNGSVGVTGGYAPNDRIGSGGSRGSAGKSSYYGGKGGYGYTNSTSYDTYYSGGGGGGSLGNGGKGGATNKYYSDGSDGTKGGGGGGGGYGYYAEQYGAGGKGGDGIVIIEW